MWSWNKDFSEATALFTCKDDKTHVYTKTVKSVITVTDATCDQEGKTVYKATVKLDGKTYTDVKETAIPAKGHNLKHVAAKEATATEKGNK